MYGIFRQKRTGNKLFLILYALALKFPNLLFPKPVLIQAEDHYLYTGLVELLTATGAGPFMFSLFAFLLLLAQAFLLNRVAVGFRMFPTVNYLPAMAYLLASSFFTEWSQFSAPFLVNTLLIWIFSLIAGLYNSNSPVGTVFNIGILSGIATLFYEPAIAFLLIIPFGLYIMRPFRIREWIIGFLGFMIPYYFLIIYLYLTGNFSAELLIPKISFDFPDIPENLDITVAITLLVIPFMIGGFLVQMNLNKMLIHVRKIWSQMLILLIISLLVIFVSGGNNYVNWISAVISLAVFHAAGYYFAKGIWLSQAIHWISFVFALYINYSEFVN